MEESLDDRITAIEHVMGIDEYSDVKTTDFDVESLLERMKNLGLGRVMKIPLSKLKSLKSLNNRVVLQTDKISIAAQQEEQLEALELDIQRGLDEWKKYTLELEDFKVEYFSVVAGLQERVEELDRMITTIEQDLEA
uniref:Biogenesis of lysosome-related organelles complex 1 subunit KXD1 n=1 Tax=Angiostrongylus cantonensis TaxID=6313 RepID=A0A158P9X1_ANGCA